MSKCVIVATGDKHLDLHTEGIPRRDEQLRILAACEEAARDVDVYVDLGDFFDTSRPSSTATADGYSHARNLRARWKFFLVGNHDRPTRGPATALDYLDKAKSELQIEVVRQPARIHVEGVTLLLLPHLTDDFAKASGYASAQAWLDLVAAEALGLWQDSPMVVFAHLEAKGISAIPVDSRQRETGLVVPDSLIESTRVHRIYIGHIHKHSVVGKVVAVGSAIHADFGGVDSRKVFTRLTFSGSEPIEEFRDLPALPARVLPIHIADGWDGHTLDLDKDSVVGALVKPIITTTESVVAASDPRPVVFARCTELGAMMVRRPELRVIRQRSTTIGVHTPQARLEDSIAAFARETKADADTVSSAIELAREADHDGPKRLAVDVAA